VLLRIESPNGTIDGNLFAGNDSLLIGSVHLNPNDDTYLATENVEIRNNEFQHGAFQLVLAGVRNCSVTHNSFTDCLNLNGVSLVINHYDATHRKWNSTNNFVTNNTFTNVRNGIVLGGSPTLRVGSFYNTVRDNLLHSGTGSGVNSAKGIYETLYADYNAVIHNGFAGVWTVSRVALIGSHSFAIDNYDINLIPEFSVPVPVFAVVAVFLVRICHHAIRQRERG